MAYKNSSSPILPERDANIARAARASDARIAEGRRQSIEGRKALYNTLMSPDQLAANFGVAAGVNAAKLQDQSEAARATGILAAGVLPSPGPGPSLGQIIQDAPEVVPLSYSAVFACGSNPLPLGPQSHSANEPDYTPVPGMPRGAPNIVQGPDGPLYFAGSPATYPGAYTLTHQPTDDSGGITGWIAEHPWLTLSLAGLGVFALSRRAR